MRRETTEVLSVQRPDFDVEQTYLHCISRVRDADLKTRLQHVAADVCDAACHYEYHAESANLHLVEPCDNVAGLVTRAEMINVYDGRMAKKGSPGRTVYDALKRLPSYGICPFCGHGLVSTLDHLLPKTHFPVFAVTPDNLVGSCMHCNHLKSSHTPTCAEDTSLHPYFDDVSGKHWLDAEVVEGAEPSLRFYVLEVDGWSAQLNVRIRKQFDTLQLDLLYGSQAAREISGQRYSMEQFFNAGGSDLVCGELCNKARSWGACDPNGWQAVTFRALSGSNWYCEGGFRGSHD